MRPTDLGANLSFESIQNKSCDFSVCPIQINDDAVNLLSRVLWKKVVFRASRLQFNKLISSRWSQICVQMNEVNRKLDLILAQSSLQPPNQQEDSFTIPDFLTNLPVKDDMWRFPGVQFPWV
ncbi:uncharacterized protein LOC126890990 [Diabrotica virgifera virgifera]|uniref:Uncharacterized protein n=1 Tax=Diabrotica virgifera virgifera TaxID=50390 RepID=A0ABM5L111_DIAVI|nr:uncharacterized protein LOC126890990 [Diabrotica virgifera virgifera]